MTVPLMVLAVGAVLRRHRRRAVTHWFSDFLGRTPSLEQAGRAAEARRAPLQLGADGLEHAAWRSAGSALAYWSTASGGPPSVCRRSLEPVYRLSRNKLYFDELYYAAVRASPLSGWRVLARVFDRASSTGSSAGRGRCRGSSAAVPADPERAGAVLRPGDGAGAGGVLCCSWCSRNRSRVCAVSRLRVELLLRVKAWSSDGPHSARADRPAALLLVSVAAVRSSASLGAAAPSLVAWPYCISGLPRRRCQRRWSLNGPQSEYDSRSASRASHPAVRARSSCPATAGNAPAMDPTSGTTAWTLLSLGECRPDARARTSSSTSASTGSTSGWSRCCQPDAVPAILVSWDVDQDRPGDVLRLAVRASGRRIGASSCRSTSSSSTSSSS